MRFPATENDDHPGPTSRRHICTGGAAVQSELIFAPLTTPSRRGPRNPGHSADVKTGVREVVRLTGVAVGFATRAVDGAGSAGAGAAAAAGVSMRSLAACANSFSSEVGVQRQVM